jgi:hypothetical protein
MNTKQNSDKSEKALRIGSVSKRKFWYRTDVYACVLCGKEKIGRQRVYNKDERGTHWHDDACAGHF